MTIKKNRVLSGMRPTGKLHIGHYFGALQNWVRLQNEEAPVAPSGPAVSAGSSAPGAEESSASSTRPYECFYFIADWHALTSDYADTSAVAQNTIEIVTDYLAAGLDPKKSIIFQQSLVPEHAELHLLLGMVTPLSWLERVPTYKEAFENVTNKDLHTYGFLGYPCLQTADIVMYSEPGTPLFVPVGEDQVSHVELSREIVRKFDFFYGFKVNPNLFIPANFFDYCKALKHLRVVRTLRDLVDSSEEPLEAGNAIKTSILLKHATEVGLPNFAEEMGESRKYFEFNEVLTEPQVMLTKTPRIPGLDGRKMSKSYSNAITLSESDDDIRKKTKVMVTDPARKRRTDTGNPDVCPVYDWHKLFSSPDTLQWAAEGCRSAGIGCIECKAKMADHLIQWIAPIRERRVEYEKHPKRVLEVIDAGSAKAREVAKVTMQRVREAVFGWNKKRADVGNS